MGLDELRNQQKEFSYWRATGDRIGQALEDCLIAIENNLEEETGLRLVILRESMFFNVMGGGDGLQVQGQEILSVHVLGTHAEASVETLNCSISRNPHGYNYRFHCTQDDGSSYPIDIERSKLEVPIRVRQFDEWTHNLWWSGSTDARKLVSAITDALEMKRQRDSEFVLEPPKTNGCVTTTASAMAVLAAIALAVYIVWGVATLPI